RQKLERAGDLRLLRRWVHLSKLIQISILVEALLVRGWIHVKTFNQRACPADLIWTLPFQDMSFSKKYFTYQPKNCALDKKQILLLHSQLATPSFLPWKIYYVF
ncbi:MAG: hypothetical protein ACR2OS_01565, partial [Paracoccaceae bacterium]